MTINDRMLATLRDAAQRLRSQGTRSQAFASAADTIERTLNEYLPGARPAGGPGQGGDRAHAGNPNRLVADLLAGLRMPSPPNAPAARSAQAPDPAAPGRFLACSHAGHAGSRDYKLYIPSGYREGQSLPLVVMLHGCTQDPDDFAAGTRMNAIAEERGCFVAYPAQTASANHSKCWNWFQAVDQQREQGEPAIIAGITRDVIGKYGIDPQRVFVAGLSAGGAMAVILGTTYPDLYAAVGVHSGLPYASAQDLPSAFAAMKEGMRGNARRPATAAADDHVAPVIVFHGDRDATVAPRNAEQIVVQALAASRAAGRSETEQGRTDGGHAYTRVVHRDRAGGELAEQWTVHGAGHAWFGGSGRGSYTDPRGPDATAEMMRFFSTHPRPAS